MVVPALNDVVLDQQEDSVDVVDADLGFLEDRAFEFGLCEFQELLGFLDRVVPAAKRVIRDQLELFVVEAFLEVRGVLGDSDI